MAKKWLLIGLLIISKMEYSRKDYLINSKSLVYHLLAQDITE